MPEWFYDNSKYFAVVLGLLAGFPLVRQRCSRLDLTDWPGGAVLLCAAFSVFSVISAILFAILEQALRGETISIGAISTYGVYFICPVMILLLSRLLHWDGRRMLDIYALYALPSLFLLRINCLICGCCGGRPIGNTGLYWFTREAEMVFYAVVMIVLLRREKRGVAPGTAFPLLMASYGVFRFVEEWFRTGDGWLHLAHGWSVIAVIIGLGLYFEWKQKGAQVKRA